MQDKHEQDTTICGGKLYLKAPLLIYPVNFCSNKASWNSLIDRAIDGYFAAHEKTGYDHIYETPPLETISSKVGTRSSGWHTMFQPAECSSQPIICFTPTTPVYIYDKDGTGAAKIEDLEQIKTNKAVSIIINNTEITRQQPNSPLMDVLHAAQDFFDEVYGPIELQPKS